MPENIIRDRYDMGMLYLRTKFHLFKEAYLIDNSNETKLIAVIKDGKLQYKEKLIPLWVSRLLFVQQKIAEKKIEINFFNFCQNMVVKNYFTYNVKVYQNLSDLNRT